MNKSKSFFPIFIPSLTVFFSSFCIMVLELVAARLIARHLGSSLYTWTSVIGVVLAGITIGNYLGGRIADRFDARKALAVVFLVSSIACVLTVILNNFVGELTWLLYLSWPMRVFSHVLLVFLIPSVLLGMISPVVAKMALDQELPTGRTVGDIYAWGAAGSIAGTFVAGYYLIANMGTIAIIWTIGAGLLLMAIFYWARFWVLYVWAVIFIVLMTMGMAPIEWAERSGAAFQLREKADPAVLYEDESQYCYIAVKQLSVNPDKRKFLQDKLVHSQIIMNDILNLQYFYHKIYAGITGGLAPRKPSVMIMGGGGYVYPRYIEKHWPGSRIDVIEIDPGVTEAAIQAFGLDRNTSINTISMDARNYVDGLLNKQRDGEEIPKYDFIYQDAINDYSVPFQLVTKEFNEKIARILADDGVYFANVIDIFDSGQFLGAMINTLEETFPYVNVLATYVTIPSIRETFVLVASKNSFDPETAILAYDKNLKLWYLSEAEKNFLKEKARGIILTDDYAPVENLLVPVVRESSKENLANKCVRKAEEAMKQARFGQSISNYERAIQLCPAMSIKLYNQIGVLRGEQGNFEGAVSAFQNAIDYHAKTGAKQNITGSIHLNLGLAFKELGKTEESRKNLAKAVEQFRLEVADTPDSHLPYARLGLTLTMMEDFKGASDAFVQALALNPGNLGYYYNLVNALQRQNRFDEAANVLEDGIEFMSDNNQEKAAIELKQYLHMLMYEKSKHQQ